jgi:hypothetical protein
MNSRAFEYVCDVCVWDVRRAICANLHLDVAVMNHVEALHATNVANVAPNALATSVRVMYEFARV